MADVRAGEGAARRILRIEIAPLTMLYVGLAVLAGWTLVRLVPVILVVVVALFLVGTLSPAVAWLEKRGIARHWGVALVFTLMVLAAIILGVVTLPPLYEQVTSLIQREPELRGRLAKAIGQFAPAKSLATQIRDFRYDGLARQAGTWALDNSPRALELAAYAASALFLGLYLMLDRDKVRGGLFAIVPRTHHIRLSRVILNLEVIVGGYIRGQVLTSAAIAVFTFVLLTIVGVRNAIALAVFAGVVDVLPYVGMLLAVAPAVIAATSKGPGSAVIVLVAMLVYEEFESRILIPRIYGRVLRLPSSVVMVALIAGGTLMGMLGALIALPVAAAVRMLIEELRLELPGETLDDPDLREKDERAEMEYAYRAEGEPAERAAAIAVEIADERRKEEGTPQEAAAVPITSGEKGDEGSG